MQIPFVLFSIVAEYFHAPDDYIDVDLCDSEYADKRDPPGSSYHFLGAMFCHCSDWDDTLLWDAIAWVKRQALIIPCVRRNKLSFDFILYDLSLWRLKFRIKTDSRPENGHRFLKGISARFKNVDSKHLPWQKVFVYCPDYRVKSLDPLTCIVHEIKDTTHWTNWPEWSSLSAAQKICAILMYCPADDLHYSDWIRWKSVAWFDKKEAWYDDGEYPKEICRAFTSRD